MDIDRELKELCSNVEAGLLQNFDRSRRRRLGKAARELDLKRGTDLWSMARTRDRFEDPDERHAMDVVFERTVGMAMLNYCLGTRIGNVFARVVDSEGKDPAAEIARLITLGLEACQEAQAPRKKAKKKG